MNYDLFGAGGDVKNEILNQRIIRQLRAGPKSKAALAMNLQEGTEVIQRALDDLRAEGKVILGIDGFQYEMAAGGYCPGPGGAAA